MTKQSYEAVFCTTPYQILAACAMRKDTVHTDIYITNQFSGSAQLAERLRRQGMFHDVIFVDAQKLSLEVLPAPGLRRIWTNGKSLAVYLKNCLTLEKTVQRYLHTDYLYSTIYVSNNAMAGRFAILHYVTKNLPFRLCYYEDGTGSYTSPELLDGIPCYDRFFRTLFFGRKAVNIPFIKQLFSPALYRQLQGTDMKIGKIPSPSCLPQGLIRDVFLNGQTVHFAEKVLIFDTMRMEILTPEGAQKNEILFRMIEDFFGSEQVLYKRHPRDTTSENRAVRKLPAPDAPFEAICDQNDCSCKILAAFYSTAVFTPKLLFDQEPVVILLYRILQPYVTRHADMDTYVQAVRNLYRHPERILVPKSEAELCQCLHLLKGC